MVVSSIPPQSPTGIAPPSHCPLWDGVAISGGTLTDLCKRVVFLLLGSKGQVVFVERESIPWLARKTLEASFP